MNFDIKNKRLLLIIAVLLLAIFLRTYKAVDGFGFAHDGDLYSWIVKDIVVNHHFRLIGQQTSTPGIFIGPLFYYSLIPFFFITSMDPSGALIFAGVLSIVTLISFYFVFTKLFSRTVGLMTLFLQAILVSRVGHDRWVVPTITTSLWEVWYLFTIINIARGNFFVLPLLGFLIGLIWHINFFLAPSLLAVVAALFFSKKLPKLGEIAGAIFFFIIPSIPFFLFEIRHNFIQINSFINSLSIDQAGGTGFPKLIHVLEQVSGNAVSLFFYPNADLIVSRYLIFFLLLIMGAVLTIKRVISNSELIVLYSWIFGVILFFTVSSKIISEYYLSNINIIILGLTALGLVHLWKFKFFGMCISLSLLLILSIYSFSFFLRQDYSLSFSYKERKAAAKFIKEDSMMKGFPCVSVSYITIPGENVGFRYFFYLNNLHVNQPGSGSPIYSITIPATIYEVNPDIKFGNIGVITPKNKITRDEVERSCSGENLNLAYPLFGYTE